jgi:hypothetical protein
VRTIDKRGIALCEPLCPGLCNVRSYLVEFN